MRLPQISAAMTALALAVGLPAAGVRPAAAQDAVVRIEQGQFKAGAGRITFAEVPVGAQNPTYPPSLYGGGPGSPTVRFGGFFRGQRLGTPAECPRGAVLTGCVMGNPAAPLVIDPASPGTSVQMNGSAAGGLSAGLAGSPRWNGPIAIWFDRDVAAVGLDGGYFDAPSSTAITVFDRQGRVLGRTANRGTGFEFLGLATRDLSPRIAGLEFHLVGAEPAGFGVDNIRFGAPEQVDLPGVRPPAPPPPPTPAPPPPPPPPRRAPILP
jgi:hypothetical protein